jgi:pimeloyl-ACP methyl ester carboxylesterase
MPVAYVEVNGTKLWVEQRGSGRAVVFLHAGLMDSRQWDAQLESFAAAGYEAIAFDVRGYGRSDPPTELFLPAEDLAALLDTLGVEEAAFVGNSMGGKVALDFALLQPDRVSALVLVCAAVGGYDFRAYSDEQGARAQAAWDAGELDRVADVWLEVWAPDGADDGIREIAYHNTKSFKTDELEGELDPPALESLGELNVPTLVLVGERDVPAMHEIAALLAERIPNAQFVEMADADHLPNLRQPKEFDRIVLEFLARV